MPEFILTDPLFPHLTCFQVYLNTDRRESEAVLQKAARLGAKAIVFTVDVMRQSKRTLDVRSKRPSKPWYSPSGDAPEPEPKKSVSESIGGYQDFNLTWADLDFIRVSGHTPDVMEHVS